MNDYLARIAEAIERLTPIPSVDPSFLKNDVFLLKDDITQLLDEYKKTENKEILKNAVDMQITKIIPKMRNIHMLKNDINEERKMFAKDNKEKDKIGHIFNYPILLNKLEYNLAENPNVISFTSN